MATLELKVKNIDVRIYRLDAIRQHEIFNKYFLALLSGMAPAFLAKNKLEVVAALLKSVQENLPAQARDELIFNHLLTPENVKVVAASMEMPYVQNRQITCEELNDLGALYKIVGEVLRFNFETFFSEWAEGYLSKLNRPSGKAG